MKDSTHKSQDVKRLRQPDDPFMVRIDSGLVQGHMHDGPEPTLEFKGIPYAATTGDKNRFRSPQPREPWGDELWIADRSGPDCLGVASGDGIFGGVIDEPRMTSERIGVTKHQAEDSLFLNIWTPGKDDQKRPVFVWIHGGGLVMDSCNRPPYVGNHLAKQGNLVVVAVNYRLSVFGMLAHPALRDPDTGYTGNWNIQDWLCALQWISRNIQYFGGDPNNVTVCGESGGSVGVNNLALIDKKIRGNLFHKIIGQSGDPVQVPLETSAKAAEKFFDLLGCKADNALDCIRSVELVKIFKAMESMRGERLFPCSDGILLPHKGARAAIEAGETKGIDWIIGSNGPGWDIGTKLSWDTLAQHNQARGGRAYRYYLPNSKGILGVHGAEMPLMFGTYADNLGVLTKRPNSQKSRGLVDGHDPAVALISSRMIRSWGNFCLTGDPSFKDETLGEVKWPVYSGDEYPTMIWDENPHTEKKKPVTQKSDRPPFMGAARTAPKSAN